MFNELISYYIIALLFFLEEIFSSVCAYKNISMHNQ